MSHFAVMIIGNDPEEQLEPYSEHIYMPPYVKYTKEQLIEKGKKEIERYKNDTYAEYLAGKIAYVEKYRIKNENHIDYLENEFPKKLNWTDEEIYNDEIRFYDDVGKDGEVYSSYNPNSKWDWYELGGRYKEWIILENGLKVDEALKGEITNFEKIIPFAVLKDRHWYERGECGWWGMVSNEKEEKKWDAEVHKLVKDLPDDTLISIYDCHI